MFYEIFAIFIALIHGVGVIFIFLSSLLSILGILKRFPRIEILYMVVAAAMLISFILSGGCTLTYFEQSLWKKAASPNTYSGGFISHYLELIGINIPDRLVFYGLIILISTGTLSIFSRRIFKR